MKRSLMITAVLCAPLCLESPSGAEAQGLSWHAERVPTGTLVTPAPISQLSCPTASESIGVDALGSVARSRNVGAATPTWKLTGVLSPTVVFNSISCPSPRLCVAIDQAGGSGEAAHIAVSTDPTGGAQDWTVGSDRFINSLQDVDCPGVHLCVIDGLGGMLTSTDPTGGIQSWKPVLGKVLEAHDGDLASWTSCPSTTLCVTVGDQGGIYSSTQPTGGNSAWKRVGSFPQILFSYVDCPTTSLCVALGYQGEIVTSTDPASADPTWVSDGTAPDLQSPTTGISCTTAGVCVATDLNGDIAATSDPTGAAPASWQGTAVLNPAPLASVTCLATGLCIAPDQNGGLARSFAPDSAQPHWVDSKPAGLGLTTPQDLTDVSCASSSLCVATAGGGEVASIVNPASSRRWRVVRADRGADLSGVSCPSRRFCAAIGANDALATSSDPTGPAGAWRPVTLKFTWQSDSDQGNDDFDAISCPSARECAAPDVDSNDIAFSRNPAGGASAWNDNYGGQYDYDQFSGVSCPTVGVCVAVGLEGDVWTQASDGEPPQLVKNGAGLDKVSCPTVSFCVATGTGSPYSGDVRYVYVGSPTGTADWKGSLIEPDQVDDLDDVACASTDLCVAVDSGGRVFVSTDPAAGASTWQATMVDPGQSLYGVSCPTTTMCVAVGTNGTAVVGRT